MSKSSVDKIGLAGELLLQIASTSKALDQSPKDLVGFCFEVADEFAKRVQEDLDLRGDAY
jgi:hypothetical protein